MAVSVGGSLFGVSGMLFFIPLMSTGYTLLRESVNNRNRARGIPLSAEKRNGEDAAGAIGGAAGRKDVEATGDQAGFGSDDGEKKAGKSHGSVKGYSGDRKKR